VNTAGVEAVLSDDLGGGFLVYASGPYNSLKFGENYLSNQNDPKSVVNTKDKNVQDAPNLLGNATLSYTQKKFSASFGGRYVSERFFTYTNDLTSTVPDPQYLVLTGSIAVERAPRLRRPF